MDIIFSRDQLKHRPGQELSDGKFIDAVEIPARAEMVLDAVTKAGIGTVSEPDTIDRAQLERVHDGDYLSFLDGFWKRWTEIEGRSHEALPLCWAVRSFRSDKIPAAIDGLLSYYCFDAGTPIGAGTWSAAITSAATAATAANRVIAGASSAFGLCRPPGHHAGRDLYGGYCFLNNAAIAAEEVLATGASKVTILDVDYHHGNGTQAIFYDRADVQFISIHADPATEYPHFLGYADECGHGGGQGATLNIPLPFGTDWPAYSTALDHALGEIDKFAPDVLIVSLGLDTYKADPISNFKLDTPDFLTLGAALARINRPTVFLLEGGYAVDVLGTNCANVLQGYLDEA